MRSLRDLWLGRLPLAIAFWRYAILYGLAFNVTATVAALILLAAGVPVAIPIIIHLLPVPYSVIAACGVWRSADRYPGKADLATAARFGVVAWFCFLLVV